MSRGPFIKQTFYATTSGLDRARDELIERIRLEQKRQYMKMLVDVPKYEIKHDDIWSSVPYVLSGDYVKPNCIIKIDKDEKENKKMEAKKCDRCGKLYEEKFVKNDSPCVFKFEEVHVSEEKQKKYSKEFIESKKTHNIYVKTFCDDIDLCPECRESFKKWFEEG